MNQRQWWNGRWSRLVRRDVFVHNAADGRWQVELRRGGPEGRLRVRSFGSEDDAVGWLRATVLDGEAGWRELQPGTSSTAGFAAAVGSGGGVEAGKAEAVGGAANVSGGKKVRLAASDGAGKGGRAKRSGGEAGAGAGNGDAGSLDAGTGHTGSGDTGTVGAARVEARKVTTGRKATAGTPSARPASGGAAKVTVAAEAEPGGVEMVVVEVTESGAVTESKVSETSDSPEPANSGTAVNSVTAAKGDTIVMSKSIAKRDITKRRQSATDGDGSPRRNRSPRVVGGARPAKADSQGGEKVAQSLDRAG